MKLRLTSRVRVLATLLTAVPVALVLGGWLTAVVVAVWATVAAAFLAVAMTRPVTALTRHVDALAGGRRGAIASSAAPVRRRRRGTQRAHRAGEHRVLPDDRRAVIAVLSLMVQ